MAVKEYNDISPKQKIAGEGVNILQPNFEVKSNESVK